MKKSQLCVGLVVSIIAMACGGSVYGTITGIYVDASAANTTPANAINGPSSSTDGLWEIRSFTGTELDTVFEAYETSEEAVPPITTTVSGLDATKIYEIRVIYWTHSSDSWGISAGLSGGSLQMLDNTTGALTGNTLSDDSLIEREALLGQVQGVTSFAVDVDGVNPAIQRNWYDGVSYLQVGVIPEPSSVTLMLFGSVGLLAISRRKRKHLLGVCERGISTAWRV